MKELPRQFLKVWSEVKLFRVTTIFFVCFLAISYVSLHFFKQDSTWVTPLFPKENLKPTERDAVRKFLDETGAPFQEIDEGFLVKKAHACRIRQELSAAGLPKRDEIKGYELFDHNTWIKGDRELQVLEMRALKGQLEKDLMQFENIQKASVILDIPEKRAFGNNPFVTKASVIIGLKPYAHMSASQLKAITHHLTGAVRGLEPHMIAISDTKGRLYKGICQTDIDPLLLKQNEMQEKIDQLLRGRIGQRHFQSYVQLTGKQEDGEVSEIYTSLLIDTDALEDCRCFEEEIKKPIQEILDFYKPGFKPLLEFVSFGKKTKLKPFYQKKQVSSVFLLCCFAVLSLALTGIFFLSRKKKTMTTKSGVDLNRLIAAIQNEKPEIIAGIISYLEPKRAKAIVALLPPSVREAVMKLENRL